MLNKDHILFIVSIVLFLTILIYPTWIYLKWDAPLDVEASEFEINLPVISWAKYLDLSKHLE